MNQILNMVLRMFMRKVISKGMDKGFDMAAKRGSKKDKPAEGVSEADRAEMAATRQKQKRAKQAMRVTRRIGRF
ncbi:MAG: hypothetical protein AAFQ54_14045 [Pseudomonadota bacterium]